MKEETRVAREALIRLASAAKGLSLSSTQSQEILGMIEDFLWHIERSMKSVYDDTSGHFMRIRTQEKLQRIRNNMTVVSCDPKSDNAFDEAMKALGPSSLKWTSKGVKS